MKWRNSQVTTPMSAGAGFELAFADQVPASLGSHLCAVLAACRHVAAIPGAVGLGTTIHDDGHLPVQDYVCGLGRVRMLGVKSVRPVLPHVHSGESLSSKLLFKSLFIVGFHGMSSRCGNWPAAILCAAKGSTGKPRESENGRGGLAFSGMRWGSGAANVFGLDPRKIWPATRMRTSEER